MPLMAVLVLGVSPLTNVNPASIQAFHSDGESLPFLTKSVGHWNSTILKYHRSGWLRVPTHLENTENQLSDGLFLPPTGYLQTLRSEQTNLTPMISTFFSFLPKLRPGVPFSTTRQEIPFGPLLPVLHITT